MSKMKITLLIGVALALMLCISPVSAFTGEEYIVVVDKSGDIPSYTYKNWAYLNEKYIHIYTDGTTWLYSIVTFRPIGISNASTMVVNTNSKRDIYLPYSVDYWEINYYSAYRHKLINPEPKYLKNSGVPNLKEYFGKHISGGLKLVLSSDQVIWALENTSSSPVYFIPDVD